MAIRPFLAMTAAEIGTFSPDIPICWMACHFSPYSLRLSNLPRSLPPGSLLMLDDITPIHGHDPDIICRQLEQCVATHSCCGLLLDFQRPENAETAALVEKLTRSLPFPVAVSDLYIAHSRGPVFLPPVPPSVSLSSYLAPWRDREIWLDLSLAGEVLTLTEQGASITPHPFPNEEEMVLFDSDLHCHYRIDMEDDRVCFTLRRSWEDLLELLSEAETLGVTTAVGLYQELHSVEEG